MKTKHRRELKENEVAQMINATREFTQEHGQRMTNAVVALVVVAGVIFAFMAYRNRQQSQGQDLLAQAMVVLNTAVVPVTATSNPGDAPAAASIGAKGTFSTEAQRLNAAVPKLKVAADAYPDTQAGIQARYHLATSLAALGQQKDAIAQFDEVVKRASGDSLYGRMAQLGKADAQAAAGEVDAAIATWKELAAKKDANLPEDAILMQLGRAYQAKGNTDEARKTFTDIVDNHPDSPYVGDARKELESLKG
ncbi:MAG TPA: tetratricopeptide repeat protein [Vicinamibacterales bacterium]|jgi:tetratricopeptide (TPR) repeat protein|nr:tetratricopeptide repeat protein [Vicinamibacterales bacterium]